MQDLENASTSVKEALETYEIASKRGSLNLAFAGVN